MFIVNATKAQVSLPIKSQNQVLSLGAGEKSPELDDKLHNELSPYVRAFGLTIEGYNAGKPAVQREQKGDVIQTNPKANTGAERAKAREDAANQKALAKAKAVAEASASKKVAVDAEQKDTAEKGETAPEQTASAEPKAEAKPTAAKKSTTTRTRRKPLARKTTKAASKK